jgi:hypothetical protein
MLRARPFRSTLSDIEAAGLQRTVAVTRRVAEFVIGCAAESNQSAAKDPTALTPAAATSSRRTDLRDFERFRS